MRVIATVNAFGERVAGSAGTRWAVAYGDLVTLWDGTEPAGELRLPEPALELRYEGGELLVAPSRPGRELRPLYQALDPWRAVAAAWDGERVIVAQAPPGGGREQQVRLYDGPERVPGAVLWADSQRSRVQVVAAGAGRLAAAAREVRVWDARTLGDELVVPERDALVRGIVLAGERVIAAYADGHVALDGGAGWRAHAEEVRGLALHGERLATGGWDGRVALWTLTGACLAEAAIGEPVAGVAFLGRDRLLALHRLPATGVTVLALD